MTIPPFKTVFFDIIGRCNARCSYCPTGSNKTKLGPAITVQRFSDVLRALWRNEVVDMKTVVGLYNWGEPFLHPDLDGIAGVINSLGLRHGLSTNASVRRVVSKDLVRNLDHLIISMPGFSQNSYSRISKLDFEIVRKNIIALVDGCRAVGFRQKVSIAYHVYQFNLHEIQQCERFACEQGIEFSPRYAIINDWWLLDGWLKGTLSGECFRQISEDILCAGIRETLGNAPSNYACPQENYLVIDEDANVIGCCQLPKYDGRFSCGNILEQDMPIILRNRKNNEVCTDCLKSGLAYYLNTSLVQPAFYTKDSISIESRWLYKLLHCYGPRLHKAARGIFQ